MKPAGFRRLCNALRKAAAVPTPIRFRLAPLPLDLREKSWAACIFDLDKHNRPTRATIWVQPGLGQPATTYLLLHETAHVVVGPHAGEEWGEHPPEFWLAYGRLYDTIVNHGGMPPKRFL